MYSISHVMMCIGSYLTFLKLLNVNPFVVKHCFVRREATRHKECNDSEYIYADNTKEEFAWNIVSLKIFDSLFCNCSSEQIGTVLQYTKGGWAGVEMGLGGLLVDFSGWTSSHGIPQIGGASNKVLRILWSLIYLGCLGMFIYQLYGIITTYISYPVTVTTQVRFNERTFPAISICSNNPYKKSQAELIPQVKDLMDNFIAVQETGNGTVSDPIYGFDKVNMTETGQFLRANENLRFIAAGLNATNKQAMTFSVDDFVIECSFEGAPCADSDLHAKWDPVYGSCLHFNDLDPAVFTSSIQGPSSGLRLVLKVLSSEFLPFVQTSGVKIAVHQPKQDAFPDAFAYNAGVGLTTHVAVKTIDLDRLSEPYGNCTFTGNTGPYYFDSEYSMEACYRSCYQEKVAKGCGCADPRINLPTDVATEFCNISQYDCVKSFSHPQTDSSVSEFVLDSCVCPQRCLSTMYSVITSTLSWPSVQHQPRECAETNFTDASAAHASMADCRRWYTANTLVVEVSFDRLTYITYAESPGFTVDDIVLNIGGQLGLWQGASIITLIEIFSLTIIFALFCCAKKKGPHLEDDEDDEDLIDGILKEAEADDDGDDGDTHSPPGQHDFNPAPNDFNQDFDPYAMDADEDPFAIDPHSPQPVYEEW